MKTKFFTLAAQPLLILALASLPCVLSPVAVYAQLIVPDGIIMSNTNNFIAVEGDSLTFDFQAGTAMRLDNSGTIAQLPFTVDSTFSWGDAVQSRINGGDLLFSTDSGTPIMSLRQDGAVRAHGQALLEGVVLGPIGQDGVYSFGSNIDGQFNLEDVNTPGFARPVMTINSTDALDVETAGYMGLFNPAPEVPFHILKDDGEFLSANEVVKIENRDATTAVRNLLTLENNGGARFALQNNDTGKRWIISTSNDDTLFWTEANSADTDTAPFFRMFLDSPNHNLLAQMGQLTGGTKFSLFQNGNLTIAGNLTESSDRNMKKDIEKVDVQEVLQKVVDLPVTTWTYKHDADTIRHMGPMAQDFRAAFGLGKDEVSIAGIDKDGVAFAAIQGLHSKVEKLESENQDVREENEDLRDRLDHIEQLLESLTSQK